MTLLFLISCKTNPVNFEGGNPGLRSSVAYNAPQLKTVPDESNGMSENPVLPDSGIENNDSVTERKIIKDANITLIVKDIQLTKVKIDSLTLKYYAYYSSESYDNTEYENSCNLVIRVPAENLESFISEIEKGLGEIYNKSVTARDVTEEYIDLATRLKNKQGYLNQYHEILKQAKSVKDILEIQDETRKIEEEIESTTGRLKFLSHQVNYSTLTLQLSKRNEMYLDSDRGSFTGRLRSSLIRGWRGLVSFTLFVIKLWPFWIIAGAMLLPRAEDLAKKQEKSDATKR